ncbi:fructose-1,6-bisphosphatase [Blautia sp.]|uniref:fructose-1,6-bisphosphatase n=1 Tax=Blautia sp. TaxID=1955243 RepID=UPI002E7606D7|nr:fructose-1,6-bisphosphatase [Blautia sp.]MEE0811624.1 fructose-1,6-bisphosphatase [Blautia sp.]
MKDRDIWIKLLKEKYPTKQAVCREIINLTAIINLPKGTEHFMSDIHGEYEAFLHIMNNCSGVIREKVRMLFSETLSVREQQEICTLIYYPREVMNRKRNLNELSEDWYRLMLNYLLELAKMVSSKYTRSKVRRALPKEFGDIIDELLHFMPDEDDNQIRYHRQILDTIIGIENSEEFIVALAELIKRLAVDHLHIVGDIFDRGGDADKILDLLMEYHSLDIEWGNHDILWMGAACGNEASIATVVKNNMKYNNIQILESGYGISLRSLVLFGENTYPELEVMEAAQKALSIILFKLEGQTILRHPEYNMQDRLLLDKIDYENKTVVSQQITYAMKDTDFPTVDREHPYELTEGEQKVIQDLKFSFLNSHRLQKHVDFLFEKGCMYKRYNENLLYHGCIPLDEQGNFDGMEIDGNTYMGREYLDYAERMVRKVRKGEAGQDEIDFMWYLWTGKKSPLCGRNIKTFERTFIQDKTAWKEPTDPYYKFYHTEKTCNMILREFGLFSPLSHIINGHTPVKTVEGEEPVRANGKLIVIDGGFSQAYHKTTGIAGYTLIYNSHGMRIKAHQPFESVEKVLEENKDIESTSTMFETEKDRIMVGDTDEGKEIKEEIQMLKKLLEVYRGK